jgi:hypothetical protein
MVTIIMHIQNEDPIVGEMEQLPGVTDQLLYIKNPRRRDGKEVHYIDVEVNTIIWPVTKINFIEIMPGKDEEEIISFVRE